MINKFLVFILIKLIRAYQLILSPYLGRNCRFTPTCSQYSIICLKRFGVLKGSFLSIKRILKCNPFGGCGIDYPPEK